jgi:CRP-like cAMP-binding protein
MARRKEARQLADTTTGEEVWHVEKQRPNYLFRPDSQGRYFMMVGALAAENLEQSGYDGVTLRLLIHVMRVTDATGLIEATQVQLANRLSVSQASISRAMKKLKRDGYLYKRGRSWFVNAEAKFSGRADQHQQAVARVPDDSRLLAVVKPIRPGAG